MNTETVLLIVIGVILIVVLILALGGGMAMGGMMMAGMMGTPVGWVVLLILAGLVALIGYAVLFAR